MLAIVIPYYKLTFFEATLESLANQTDQRFTVYIGDDASTENPAVLLEKFNGTFNFVYKRFDNNLGGTSLTKQWERCIALLGDEKWLMILGDDDVLGENVVGEFYVNLDSTTKNEIHVVRYASQLINKNGESISMVFKHPFIEKSTDFIIKKLRSQTRSSLSEYVFMKDNLIKIGFKDFPSAWYVDDLAILEFSRFKMIYTINQALVYIRFSALSISGDSNFLKQKNKAKFEFFKYLLFEKRVYFSKSQYDFLFFNLSKCFLNSKLKIGYFFKISWISLRLLLVTQYFEFIKSIVSSVFVKK